MASMLDRFNRQSRRYERKSDWLSENQAGGKDSSFIHRLPTLLLFDPELWLLSLEFPLFQTPSPITFLASGDLQTRKFTWGAGCCIFGLTSSPLGWSPTVVSFLSLPKCTFCTVSSFISYMFVTSASSMTFRPAKSSVTFLLRLEPYLCSIRWSFFSWSIFRSVLLNHWLESVAK